MKNTLSIIATIFITILLLLVVIDMVNSYSTGFPPNFDESVLEPAF